MKNSVNKHFSGAWSSLLVAASAAGILISVAGCSDTPENTATTSRTATPTSASTASATPADAVTDISTTTETAVATETVTAPPTVDTAWDGTAPCVRSGASAIVGNAITEIPTPVPGGQWVPGDSNFDSCDDFTYVTLDTLGGTVSSPQQLMFFHYHEFLGTGTACNLPYQQVTGTDDNQVHVTYRYIVGDEANASPQGLVSVTYRWNGSGVDMIGELPPAVTGGRC
ncbi:UNVERIFIED_CONTAM: LppP/LprE lipoprotein [Williamsia faeni]